MPALNIERHFNSFISVYRKENAKDAFGGVSSSWEKKDWEVNARIYGISGKPYSIAVEGSQYLVSARLMVGEGKDIRVGDKIAHEKTNKSYIVVDVSEVQTSTGIHHIEAYLSKI